MNSKSMRRLAKDRSDLHRDGLPPNYLFAPSSDASDLTSLDVLLAGPPGTPYSKGVWRLHLDIPATYPTAPPTATFRTRMWHPNVDEATGAVCVETLKRDWVSTLKLRDVLVTINCLLIQPNPASALNEAAGVLASDDWEGYCRRATLMTSIHAAVPGDLTEEVREAQSRGEDKLAIVEETKVVETKAAETKVVEAKVNGEGKGERPASTTPLKDLRHMRLMSEDEENRTRRGDTVELESDPESDWIPGPPKLLKPLSTAGDNIFGIKGLGESMKLITPPATGSSGGSEVSSTNEPPSVQDESNGNPFITIPSKPRFKATPLAETIANQTSSTSPYIATKNPFAAIAPITDEHPLLKEFSWSWAESKILHDTGTNTEGGELEADVRKRMAGEDFEAKKKWELKRFKQAGYDMGRYNRGDFGPRTGSSRL